MSTQQQRPHSAASASARKTLLPSRDRKIGSYSKLEGQLNKFMIERPSSSSAASSTRNQKPTTTGVLTRPHSSSATRPPTGGSSLHHRHQLPPETDEKAEEKRRTNNNINPPPAAFLCAVQQLDQYLHLERDKDDDDDSDHNDHHHRHRTRPVSAGTVLSSASTAHHHQHHNSPYHKIPAKVFDRRKEAAEEGFVGKLRALQQTEERQEHAAQKRLELKFHAKQSREASLWMRNIYLARSGSTFITAARVGRAERVMRTVFLAECIHYLKRLKLRKNRVAWEEEQLRRLMMSQQQHNSSTNSAEPITSLSSSVSGLGGGSPTSTTSLRPSKDLILEAFPLLASSATDTQIDKFINLFTPKCFRASEYITYSLLSREEVEKDYVGENGGGLLANSRSANAVSANVPISSAALLHNSGSSKQKRQPSPPGATTSNNNNNNISPSSSGVQWKVLQRSSKETYLWVVQSGFITVHYRKTANYPQPPSERIGPGGILGLENVLGHDARHHVAVCEADSDVVTWMVSLADISTWYTEQKIAATAQRNKRQQQQGSTTEAGGTGFGGASSPMSNNSNAVAVSSSSNNKAFPPPPNILAKLIEQRRRFVMRVQPLTETDLRLASHFLKDWSSRGLQMIIRCLKPMAFDRGQVIPLTEEADKNGTFPWKSNQKSSSSAGGGKSTPVLFFVVHGSIHIVKSRVGDDLLSTAALEALNSANNTAGGVSSLNPQDLVAASRSAAAFDGGGVGAPTATDAASSIGASSPASLIPAGFTATGEIIRSGQSYGVAHAILERRVVTATTAQASNTNNNNIPTGGPSPQARATANHHKPNPTTATVRNKVQLWAVAGLQCDVWVVRKSDVMDAVAHESISTLIPLFEVIQSGGVVSAGGGGGGQGGGHQNTGGGGTATSTLMSTTKAGGGNNASKVKRFR